MRTTRLDWASPSALKTAEAMWRKGESPTQIALRVGTSTAALKAYAKRHWGKRGEPVSRDPNRPSWTYPDKKLLTEAKIAQAEIQVGLAENRRHFKCR